jgi:hypothetical protein
LKRYKTSGWIFLSCPTISAATGLPHSQHPLLAVFEDVPGRQSEKLAIGGFLLGKDRMAYFSME